MPSKHWFRSSPTHPPADDKLRDNWLKRLCKEVEAEDIPYIEMRADSWGDLCASGQCASHRADEFIDSVRLTWGPKTEPGGYVRGTAACLSALPRAARNEEILRLSAGLNDQAIELADQGPCDPKPLVRAAREMADKEPRFALEAGMAALM